MTRAYAFDEDGKRRANKSIRWTEQFREKQNRRQRRQVSLFDDLRIYNGTNESMPQYGIGKVTSITTYNGEKYATVEKPDTTFSRQYLVNSGSALAYQSTGVAKNRPVVKVLYDTGTPAAGEVWGPKPGQFTASKGYPGFVVLGIVDSTNKIMLARQEPYDKLIGKLTATLSTGANTVNIWAGAAGSETVVSGWTVSAYPWQNLPTCAYPCSTTAKLQLVNRNGVWYIEPLPIDYEQISGYSGSTRQYLRHDTSGCLQWHTPGSC